MLVRVQSPVFGDARREELVGNVGYNHLRRFAMVMEWAGSRLVPVGWDDDYDDDFDDWEDDDFDEDWYDDWDDEEDW